MLISAPAAAKKGAADLQRRPGCGLRNRPHAAERAAAASAASRKEPRAWDADVEVDDAAAIDVDLAVGRSRRVALIVELAERRAAPLVLMPIER